MWQMLVPMIMTMIPGSVTRAAGTVTCASTLATATAMPGFRPIQAAASAVRSPARPPSGASSFFILVSITSARSGCSAAKYLLSGNLPS